MDYIQNEQASGHFLLSYLIKHLKGDAILRLKMLKHVSCKN